jgi:hypothetical protein
LDQSLEPKLGTRLAQMKIFNFGTLHPGDCYPTPKLYLDNTPLLTKPRFILDNTPLLNCRSIVVTTDFNSWSKDPHFPVMGILGMDVMKHYCLQLDFQSSQARFLDAEHADKKDWGRPFHLTYTGDGCVSIDENLTGARGPHSLIDTGDDGDGFLTPTLFQQWTNQAALPANGEARSPNGLLGGDIYHELELAGLEKTNHDSHSQFNGIGIHVLSRNLVTLDFPERTMYLKRASDLALVDKDTEAAVKSAGESVGKFSRSLRIKGQLPGWTTIDVPGKAIANWPDASDLDLVTLEERKEGDSSVYHYTFKRASRSSPWGLEKAWRTDQGDKTIEEFPVR